MKDVFLEFFKELEEIEEFFVIVFGFLVFFVGNFLFIEVLKKYCFE